MTTYEEIFENNRKWIAQKTGTDKDFFRATGQRAEPGLFIHWLQRQPGNRRRIDGRRPWRSVCAPQYCQSGKQCRSECDVGDQLCHQASESEASYCLRTL